MVVDVYGTDINRKWEFTNGDIDLVDESVNLGQAIVNRLNAGLDTYDLFYAKYGGILLEHLGDLNHPNIHEYIRIEIESILEQEPRITEVECTVNKTGTSSVEINLKVAVLGSDTVDEFNLVINEDSYIELDGNMSEMNDVRV